MRQPTQKAADLDLCEATVGASAAPTRPRLSSDTPVGLSQPPHVLQQATRRLGTATLVWAALWSLALIMNAVVAPALSPSESLDDAWPIPGAPVAVVVIFLSLCLWLGIRRSNVAPARMLDIGLGYEVALAFAIGLVNQWTPNTTGLSWICVLVLVFPFIVPNSPLKTLTAALAAASMDAVGLAITAARGEALPPAAMLVWAMLPNYICAFLAVVPSRIIQHLGRRVSRAERLGRYRLGELLGSGGTGEVYRATHDLLLRPAAIKLLRPDLLGAASPHQVSVMVERFVREANAAAMLRSPNTVDLYDFGVAEDGTLFHVMELLDGVDLETLVREHGPVTPARAAHILAQVCNSLAEAHSLGLVHRDIKPSNIQICQRGMEVDHVKVLDFGLVKALDSGLQASASLTCPDAIMGTPAFMAPEIAIGDRVDWRADIYALGCVGYWLLTGRHVFEGDSVVVVASHHLYSTPEPPTRDDGRPIPRELQELVMACLEKSPLDRPQSMRGLERALRSIRFDTPWSDARAQRWADAERSLQLCEQQ